MNKSERLAELEAEAERLRAELKAEQVSKQSEGVERLSQITKNMLDQIKRGEEIAEEYGIYWSLDGHLPYGMGGSYQPHSRIGDRYREDGWQASSHSC